MYTIFSLSLSLSLSLHQVLDISKWIMHQFYFGILRPVMERPGRSKLETVMTDTGKGRGGGMVGKGGVKVGRQGEGLWMDSKDGRDGYGWFINDLYLLLSDSLIFNVKYHRNEPEAVFQDLATLAPALDLSNFPLHHPMFLLASEEERAQLLHLREENTGILGKLLICFSLSLSLSFEI